MLNPASNKTLAGFLGQYMFKTLKFQGNEYPKSFSTSFLSWKPSDAFETANLKTRPNLGF